MTLRLLAALLLAAVLPAQAEVYKWIDAKGQVHYSNAPPAAVAGSMQPVEERISVMGMDPEVRAYAERRLAAREAQEARDWQLRQQAMSDQYSRPPVAEYASPAYDSSYYAPYYYGGGYYSGGARHHHFRPRVSHHHRGGARVAHHGRR
jgi:hypothetical protein